MSDITLSHLLSHLVFIFFRARRRPTFAVSSKLATFLWDCPLNPDLVNCHDTIIYWIEAYSNEHFDFIFFFCLCSIFMRRQYPLKYIIYQIPAKNLNRKWFIYLYKQSNGIECLYIFFKVPLVFRYRPANRSQECPTYPTI